MISVDASPRPSSSLIPAETDIVRRFLAWMQRAPAEGRAEAVSALARAYLYSPLSDEVRRSAVVALTSVLDDPSARVRRALAEALASAANAPRHIVLGLASDQSEVARVVLARSPALEDSELVDCAAIGDLAVQIAVARRPRLRAGVAGALAEIGRRSAVLALVGNLEAELTEKTLRRILERFGGDAEIREAMLSRAVLPAALRAEIAAATARELAEFVSSRGWLEPRRAERIAREAREQAAVSIARRCSPRELAELVTRLRDGGELTVALLMRALLSGEGGLFPRTLVQMSGLPEGRVAGFLRSPGGQGFAALYAKAGLPGHFLPAFRAAVAVVADGPSASGDQISHALTMRLINACEKLRDPQLAPILSMLWRFAGEGARENAREFAAEAVIQEAAPRTERIEPQAIGTAPKLLAIAIEGVNENFAPLVPPNSATPEAMADAA